MVQSVERRGETQHRDSDIRVLIVEDDPLLSEVSATYLERLNDTFDVVTETDPTEAVQRLEREPFDCIVSDFVMPEMDGIELLETVRDTHDDLPFILLTGKGDEDLASEAMAKGVTDYLRKRRDTDQYETLSMRIHDAVERRGRSTATDREHALLTAAPAVAAVVDPNGTVRWVEESIHDRLDRSGADVRGDNVFSFVHDEDVQALREAFFEVVEGSADSFERDCRIETGDGTWTWMAVSGRPLDTDSDDLEVGLFLRDVDDRHERAATLEQRVEHLDEFATIVSHDLRNPLTVARGRLEMALDECESAHLEEVERAHERIDRLIDDLLEFARAGSGAIDEESIDLAELVETCCRDLLTGGATLEVATDRTVTADPQRLRQLLENLIKNALDHGGPEVAITIGDLEDGFFVADDGPGIPADDRDRIFELGYSTSDEGVGFGLAIVKRLAEAHGWAVAVTESAAGGARFEVTGVEMAT